MKQGECCQVFLNSHPSPLAHSCLQFWEAFEVDSSLGLTENWRVPTSGCAPFWGSLPSMTGFPKNVTSPMTGCYWAPLAQLRTNQKGHACFLYELVSTLQPMPTSPPSPVSFISFLYGSCKHVPIRFLPENLPVSFAGTNLLYIAGFSNLGRDLEHGWERSIFRLISFAWNTDSGLRR